MGDTMGFCNATCTNLEQVYVLVLEDVTQVLGQVCNTHTHNFNTTWVEPMSLHNIDQCFCC